MDATGWWSTTEATTSKMTTAMWWITGLMHPSTIAATTEAIVTYSRTKIMQFNLKKFKVKFRHMKNSKNKPHHDSVDRRRANRYAFASLVALDPVKIYHVVDIHGNLDGVY